ENRGCCEGGVERNLVATRSPNARQFGSLCHFQVTSAGKRALAGPERVLPSGTGEAFFKANLTRSSSREYITNIGQTLSALPRLVKLH
ncbi:hypothetical protein M404DRAFT_992703, partial [Pisolithus tinctorius Marx 270]